MRPSFRIAVPSALVAFLGFGSGCGDSTVQIVSCYELQVGSGARDGGTSNPFSGDGGVFSDASSCAPAGKAIFLVGGIEQERTNSVDEGPILQANDAGGFSCCYLVTISEGTLSLGP